MKYQIAEKFKSIQGEGVYAGTPMAFIRFVGCSVGKKICQHCDTVFEKMLPWQGGGEFSVSQLMMWADPYQHICFTGGEPLDQDLQPLYEMLAREERLVHIETSGTKMFPEYYQVGAALRRPWICVSPKPGFLEKAVLAADEVKVIVPGLGTSESLGRLTEIAAPGNSFALGDPPQRVHPLGDRENFYWPTPYDALRWAHAGKIVFLQPRNDKFEIDRANLMYCQDFIRDNPELRLSVQLHKILKVQ